MHFRLWFRRVLFIRRWCERHYFARRQRSARRFALPHGPTSSRLSFPSVVEYRGNVTVELVSYLSSRSMDFVDDLIAVIRRSHHPPSLPACK
jgi:hypothetical protein